MPILHDVYANIHDYSRVHFVFFKISLNPLLFYCRLLLYVYSSFNNPTITSITRFTFFRNSCSSSEPSFKTDLVNLILSGFLLVQEIPSEAYKIKYHSTADNFE